jgi:hypothetical protein
MKQRLIDAARAACGYRALPGLGSTYGQAAGYPQQPWDGSFITVTARDIGLNIPATSTSTALSEFVRTRRMYAHPKPGDIVFYTFSANGQFGQPHVGIVTDTKSYRSLGQFTAVEAQVSSGLPKSSKSDNGVFERTRHITDVIGFGRPKFRVSRGRRDKTDSVQIATRNIGYGKSNRWIETVQHALATQVPITGAARGKFDNSTRSAYACFQRQIGLVGTDANGVPDEKTLTVLGERSGLFKLKE